MHPWYAFEALVIRMATRERYVDLETLFKESVDASAKGAVPLSASALRSNERVSGVGGQYRQVQQEVQADSVSVLQGASAQAVAPTWSEFLEFASRQRCAPFLLESLKRSLMQRFSQGNLTLISGSFEYKNISTAENLKTLQTLLGSYSGIPSWNIELKEQERVRVGAVLPGERALNNGGADASDRIFEALNEVFPGCRVEPT
jgi:hypothetical protein